ncbi:MAG TPA: HAD family hydrolase [Chloroflexi bacterium]|nr:HAD family hydrolase [Chloroflexota bacterium]
MLNAVLFDLDGTLLGNEMGAFVPVYFKALTDYMAHLIPPEQLIAGIMAGTQAMDANDGTGATNQEAFERVCYARLDKGRDNFTPVLRQFYREHFPQLRPVTQRLPEARRLVDWAFEQNLEVVIATNPVFPRQAVEHRLAWAGVPVSEYDYALVTSYENMHATKVTPAYYREILSYLGLAPEACVMIGDSWKLDIVPAAAVGIPSYWIVGSDSVAQDDAPSDDGVPLIGSGTLADLWRQVEEEGRLQPSTFNL